MAFKLLELVDDGYFFKVFGAETFTTKVSFSILVQISPIFAFMFGVVFKELN